MADLSNRLPQSALKYTALTVTSAGSSITPGRLLDEKSVGLTACWILPCVFSETHLLISVLAPLLSANLTRLNDAPNAFD